MSRIQARFTKLQAEGRKALIPFITAGFPAPADTLPLMRALVAGGADLIELGVPFSDPMADGPTVQRASEVALAQGMSLHGVLDIVRAYREEDDATPVVLMGYANPVEAYGCAALARDAAAAGVDGLLVVDYPPEEAGEFVACLREHRLDPIFLLAPTSTEARFAQVAELGSGYIYYVSLKGVTGSGALDLDEVARRIPLIRSRVGMPVGVGFGIRDAASAARIASVADAVVIGSRIIEEIEHSPHDEILSRVQAFMQDIRAALDSKEQPL
ncbi:Tryptophan synthase alpha chain [Sterolibacterium denitrificans]|uniref:Tryptophan synthase alpha chain n=2 Tax=Sterolibacterium denitrificans TaxID=157592 RepID=A0A656Z9T4_9PROT|nr:tryptophan synthase subunit alpha [Sterolibacterium denitrificans]KYC29265.1 tryptophan synthase alpha chain [Sterolibacterium denitrificans]SMB30272.1 Tryptophan synthase alpha chain [Sterolibacterium denitrificans]